MDFIAPILFMAYELQKQLKKYWISNRGNQLITRNSYKKYFKSSLNDLHPKMF